MQAWMPRQVAGMVMVEVLHDHAPIEQRDKRVVIGRGGYVECRHGIAALRGYALKQRNVALDARDEHRLRRGLQPELMQRAQPVGIAVEHVELGHGRQAEVCIANLGAGQLSADPRHHYCREAIVRSSPGPRIDRCQLRGMG